MTFIIHLPKYLHVLACRSNYSCLVMSILEVNSLYKQGAEKLIDTKTLCLFTSRLEKSIHSLFKQLFSYTMSPLLSSLPAKPLGRNGPLVSSLGFGAMGLSAFYGKTDNDSERLKILDRAYELGARHWDTADMYGDNEDLIGSWFKMNPGKRADIFLATKFGAIVSASGITIRSDPEYARIACETSLQRLGVTSIDLYYCHRVDEKTPIEKTVKAMVELQRYATST